MEELIKIQSELNAPKNLFNKFGNYKYRSCESIVEALKPLMKKYACYLVINDEIVNIGERFYVKATATITNGKGIAVSSNAYAREEESKKGMDGSQLTGATSSYARKYALNGLFAIDDTKDADATNVGDSNEPSADEKEYQNKAKALIEKIDSIEGLKKFYTDNKEQIDSDVAIKKILTEKKNQLVKQIEKSSK